MLLRKQKRQRKLGVPRGKKLLLLLFLILFGFFFVVRPAQQVLSKGRKIEAQAKVVKAAFDENDLVKVEEELKETQVMFEGMRSSARWLYPWRFIPFFGGYVGDFRAGVEAGHELIQAAIISVEAIEPYADLIGFRKGTDAAFLNRPAEERLQTAVLTLDKIVGQVDQIAPHVDRANEYIQKINPNRYPKSIAGKEIRGKVASVKGAFGGIATFFVDAKPLIKNLPEILGAEREQTYVILFMNDKELRPTGGFLTAYSVFRVDKGRFKVDRSSDIYSLDATISTHPPAPREIKSYHKNVNRLFIRDSNLSPDYLASIRMFEELYDKSSERVDYDGIIAVDTHVLVDALEILGDTEVRGVLFSSKTDKRCNCPQVIYRLLDEIDRPVAYMKEDRKGILGDLLLGLTQKALGFSPSQYWGSLSQMMIKNLNEKHVLVYMIDKETQKSMEGLNFAGRIKEFDGDYLHINDTNFAGAKSNLYVKHQVKSETEITRSGKVERTLTLEYRNPEPHSNCNLEFAGVLGQGGLCINATLRNWLRIYVPLGSKLVEFKGSQTKVESYDELGKTVFEGFMTVQPEGKAQVTVKYTLPFEVDDKDNYKLLIQKQPGTVGHSYQVLVNGDRVRKLSLIIDETITTH